MHVEEQLQHAIIVCDAALAEQPGNKNVAMVKEELGLHLRMMADMRESYKVTEETGQLLKEFELPTEWLRPISRTVVPGK
ncbi:hypothetical protein HY224_03335 [Candidatus Uhrbacteria bacterium]|nr:hypothetical protein [Candidatus Uhrbacteria bacterium]